MGLGIPQLFAASVLLIGRPLPGPEKYSRAPVFMFRSIASGRRGTYSFFLVSLPGTCWEFGCFTHSLRLTALLRFGRRDGAPLPACLNSPLVRPGVCRETGILTWFAPDCGLSGRACARSRRA